MDASYQIHANRNPQHTPDHLTPPPTAAPPGAELAEHHTRYLEERAADQQGARRTFWTARKPAQIPEAFSERQRRLGCALIAELSSPDGESVLWQARFDRPPKDKRGRPVKWMSPSKKPSVLGALPEMLEEVRTGNDPLWISEGPTRAAALARFGIPAVILPGAWNGFKDGEPIGCWRHVNLERLVLLAFDHDAKTNESVQMAQEQIVRYVESRGARVLIVDVPEINGDEHTGLDDAIAHGIHPMELARSARPFAPVDVGRVRLSRDERLRRFIVQKRQEVGELPARKAGECNALKVARYLVETAALRHGKLEERGAVIHPSTRQISEDVCIGLQTTYKALKYLEAIGFLERLPGPRGPHEAASYLLPYPSGGGSALSEHIGGTGGAQNEGQEHRGKEETPQTPLSARVSYLSVHSMHMAEKVPALRNSKLVHTYARRDGRRVVVDSEYFKRYGAKRELIIRYVLERGSVSVAELWERFGSGSSRPGRFFETWISPMLEDGVLIEDAGGILPAPDWLEALERVRARTDEDADNRKQAERYAESRRKYREHLAGVERGEIPAEADEEGELMGPEHMAPVLEERETEDEQRQIEEARRKAGVTPAVFLADELAGTSGARYRELGDRWVARGGKREVLRRAVQEGPFTFRREAADGDNLYVYPAQAKPEGPGESPDAAIVPLHRRAETPRQLPYKNSNGVYIHPPDCSCEWCDEDLAPSYARPSPLSTGSGA